MANDLNLTDQLMSKESPLVQGSFITSMELDSLLDRSSITTSKVQNASVTSAKLSSDAVGSASIADNSISASKLVGSAVTTIKIDGQAVTAGKIANGAVNQDKLAGSAVYGTHIHDYDLAKGTGNTLTCGTVNASSAFQFNGTAGINGTVAIQDLGTVTHTMTFYKGILISYGTA
jgi:hypothetical protein